MPLAAIVCAICAAIAILSISHHHTILAVSRGAHCLYRAGANLPDPHCTPGAINHAVKQTTIHSTVCVRGWTSTIRPPVTVTEPQKFASMRDYGVTGPSGFEFDHLIPLELGGAPDSTRNLWPEPHTNSYKKDRIENRLREEVCKGEMTLGHARRIMRTDWRKG